MFRLQEREKRRRRVLIEQMKAHEAQEVRKTNSTNVGNVRFSTICYFSPQRAWLLFPVFRSETLWLGCWIGLSCFNREL